MSTSRAHVNLDVKSCLEKLTSLDHDLRTMALIDIHNELLRATAVQLSAPGGARRQVDLPTYADETTEKQLTVAALKALLDPIGEVKNMAVSCVGVMIRRARPPYVKLILDELVAGVMCSDKENQDNEGRRDISCLALKTVVVEMPRDGQHISQGIEHIVQQVYTLVVQTSTDSQLAAELLQVLTDIYTNYSNIIASSSSLQTTSIESLITILTSGRLSVRKRAIPALVALIGANPSLFDALKGQLLSGLQEGGDTGKVWAMVIASLARGQSAAKIGGLLADGKVVKLVLKQAEDPEEIDTAEGALVALEVLILRCPSEISPFVAPITNRALELVKYDPNFVDTDDEGDVEMESEEEEAEDDDYDQDGYSDDDDVSWKVRRSAAKLLSAILSTRAELLSEFYRNVAPILVGRINEREESVRLEVLDAFESLLKQTLAARQAELASGGRNKRKRSEGMDEDSVPEDSVTAPLSTMLPQLTRPIIKQLDGKSVAAKERCFVLLKLVSEVLGGGLETDAPRLIAAAVASLRSADSATTPTLAIASLGFCASFIKTHPARTYRDQLDEIAAAIVRCIRDKVQRVGAEAFTTASALAVSLGSKGSASPVKGNAAGPIKQLFDATAEVLANTSLDAEYRDRALETLGDLLVHEGDILSSSCASALPLIAARLETDTTSNTAIAVIGRIAESPTTSGSQVDEWLLDTLPQVIVALRRSRRASTKQAEVATIGNILARVGSLLSVEAATGLVTEVQPILDSSAGLLIIAALLRQQPAVRTAVEAHLVTIYELVKRPGNSSAVIDALVSFFSAYTATDPDSATRTAPKLVSNLGAGAKIVEASQGGTVIYGTTARIVGAITKESLRNAAGILALFMKLIKESGEASTYLSLLSIGEIGRLIDLSTDMPLFDKILSFFKSASEEIRSAAAFAAGNLAVGSHEKFLPLLVKHIESADSETTRVLLLHALKEVILHTPSAQLEFLAESLWAPLIAEDGSVGKGKAAASKRATKADGSADNIGDESVRNVRAACIGKLTTTAPAKFLPQLQSLLRSSPRNRAIVAAAVRYTFIDASSSYDELIAPLIVEFLSLMHDENLIVRRLSLASLNAAIQNKPHLIVDRLATLQPLLYQETVINKNLQRIVVMGPFKHIEDDGLENRKTAYETMYTLLATCFNKIDLPAFTDRVMAALEDVNEIKVLGLMLLLRLGQLSPSSVVPRLDAAVETMKGMMKNVEVKDDTILQDLERKAEMQKTTLRTIVPLARISTPQQAPAFHAFLAGLLSDSAYREFRDYQA